MEYGQTLDDRVLKNIDFTLPSLDSELELQQLERLRRARDRAMQTRPQIIRVGAPVWGEPRWVGSIYPKGTKSSNFLSVYQTQFKTVEINSSFYAVPARTTFEKWVESVDDEFQFCPKFPKSVSHRLSDLNRADLQNFYQGLEPMREKLGMTFLQLPPNFAAKIDDRRGRTLLKFLDEIPRWLKTGVEFRNPIFTERNYLKREWVEALAERFVSTVVIDTALEREAFHVSLSSSKVMVRFLGADLHESDFPRLEAWAKRCAVWLENGLQELYFLVHEPGQVHAAKAIQFFDQVLNRELEARALALSVPEPVFHDLFGGHA